MAIRKLIWAVLLTAWITVPYYCLQHFVLFPVHELSPSAVDLAVPFSQTMAWPYLSLFLLIPVAPLYLAAADDIRRFVGGFFLLGLVSSLIFLFWPTAIPRPECDIHDPAFALIVGVDRPLNALPSLHASMAVYSALWCTRLLRRWAAIAIWIWTLLVLYATIATRQHVLIDLIAGAVLAIAAFSRMSWMTPARS